MPQETKTKSGDTVTSEVEPRQKKLFTLHYRKGNAPPATRNFEFHGELKEAIVRSQLHCERMGLRFCGCYLMVVDLHTLEEAQDGF